MLSYLGKIVDPPLSTVVRNPNIVSLQSSIPSSEKKFWTTFFFCITKKNSVKNVLLWTLMVVLLQSSGGSMVDSVARSSEQCSARRTKKFGQIKINSAHAFKRGCSAQIFLGPEVWNSGCFELFGRILRRLATLMVDKFLVAELLFVSLCL